VSCEGGREQRVVRLARWLQQEAGENCIMRSRTVGRCAFGVKFHLDCEMEIDGRV